MAGAHPNFADEDVFEFTLGAAFDGHGLGRGVRIHGVEADLPASILVGGGFLDLTGEGHFDLGIGSVPTPNRVGLLLLQDHVVANDGGEFQFGVCSQGQRREGEGQSEEWVEDFHG